MEQTKKSTNKDEVVPWAKSFVYHLVRSTLTLGLGFLGILLSFLNVLYIFHMFYYFHIFTGGCLILEEVNN